MILELLGKLRMTHQLLKNRAIALLVELIKKKKNQSPKARFLIISTTGLGDTLWATPAIRALRAAYPKEYIGGFD